MIHEATLPRAMPGQAGRCRDMRDQPPKDRRKDSLLRIGSVCARTGMSVATIYRREAAGTFPKRERLGPRMVAWYESDIDDFVAAPLTYRVS